MLAFLVSTGTLGRSKQSLGFVQSLGTEGYFLLNPCGCKGWRPWSQSLGVQGFGGSPGRVPSAHGAGKEHHQDVASSLGDPSAARESQSGLA